MPVKTATVSIVIPAYNESVNIERCLVSCVEQTKPAHEIIVVNNMSTDDTAAIVKRLQRKYKDQANIRLFNQNKSQGVTPTRTYGLDHASGDVLGRIDADSIIDSDWVEQVQHIFRDKVVAAATGPVVYHDMPARKFGFRADEQIRTMLDKLSHEYKFLFGSNMAIRAAAWHAIKIEICTDEDDKLHEDIDLAIHLTESGYKIVYDSHMIGGMSARRLEDRPRQFYSYVMRYERTFKHHAIKSAAARIPMFIYLSTYFPLRAIRFAYNPETNRLSLTKFRKTLAEAREKGDEAVPL